MISKIYRNPAGAFQAQGMGVGGLSKSQKKRRSKPRDSSKRQRALRGATYPSPAPVRTIMCDGKVLQPNRFRKILAERHQKENQNRAPQGRRADQCSEILDGCGPDHRACDTRPRYRLHTAL